MEAKRNVGVVREANKIPIEQVLMDRFNIDVPLEAGSWKTDCPLGAEHSDGGVRKSMRVYSTSNSAWCFSHSMKFSPVYLWQIATGLPRVKAAYDMLEYFEVTYRRKSPTERWNELNEFQDESSFDVDHIREAVRLYATTLPGFSTRQYDAEVMRLMNEIYSRLESLKTSTDYDTIETHLTKIKEILRNYWRHREWD